MIINRCIICGFECKSDIEMELHIEEHSLIERFVLRLYVLIGRY